jgi:hypothetical protein
MSRKKAADPKKLALLAVGVVLAAAFAAWNISRALEPPERYALVPQTPPAGRPGGQAGAVPPGAAQPGAAQPGAGAANAQAPGGNQAPEATRAPGADPFRPLPGSGAPAMIGGAPAGQARVRESMMPPGRPLPPAGAPTMMTRRDAPPGSGRRGRPEVGGPRPPTSLQPAVPTTPPPDPVLVGTIMGSEQSVAVFRSGSGVVRVPQGETVGPWRVVSVDHGAVVVRMGRQERRLTVARTEGATRT